MKVKVRIPKLKLRPLRLKKDKRGRFIKVGRKKLYVSPLLQKNPKKVLEVVQKLRKSELKSTKGKNWRLVDPKSTALVVAQSDRDFFNNIKKVEKNLTDKIVNETKAEIRNIENSLDAQGAVIPRPLKNTILDINKTKNVDQLEKLVAELTKALQGTTIQLPAPPPTKKAPAPPPKPPAPTPKPPAPTPPPRQPTPPAPTPPATPPPTPPAPQPAPTPPTPTKPSIYIKNRQDKIAQLQKEINDLQLQPARERTKTQNRKEKLDKDFRKDDDYGKLSDGEIDTLYRSLIKLGVGRPKKLSRVDQIQALETKYNTEIKIADDELNKKLNDIQDDINKKTKEIQKLQDEIDKKQQGKGQGDSGLTNIEINEMMKPFYKLGFQGAIPLDYMKNIEPWDDPFSFIVNNKKSNSNGEHWTAVFIDPNIEKEINFYDPYGLPPDPDFYEEIKPLVDKMDLPYLLKFKINGVAEQDIFDEDDNTCGFHCMGFIIKRYNGMDFKYASPFMKDIEGGRNNVEKIMNDFNLI